MLWCSWCVPVSYNTIESVQSSGEDVVFKVIQVSVSYQVQYQFHFMLMAGLKAHPTRAVYIQLAPSPGSPHNTPGSESV